MPGRTRQQDYARPMATPHDLLAMLAELHDRGYQRLRISCGMSPAGMHWRHMIAPRSYFEPNGYWLKSNKFAAAAVGSLSDLDQPPFQWPEEMAGRPPAEMADYFEAHHAALLEDGKGKDAAYAAWLRAMLEACGQDGALILFDDYSDPATVFRITSRPQEDRRVPPPPPRGR